VNAAAQIARSKRIGSDVERTSCASRTSVIRAPSTTRTARAASARSTCWRPPSESASPTRPPVTSVKRRSRRASASSVTVSIAVAPPPTTATSDPEGEAVEVALQLVGWSRVVAIALVKRFAPGDARAAVALPFARTSGRSGAARADPASISTCLASGSTRSTLALRNATSVPSKRLA